MRCWGSWTVYQFKQESTTSRLQLLSTYSTMVTSLTFKLRILRSRISWRTGSCSTQMTIAQRLRLLQISSHRAQLACSLRTIISRVFLTIRRHSEQVQIFSKRLLLIKSKANSALGPSLSRAHRILRTAFKAAAGQYHLSKDSRPMLLLLALQPISLNHLVLHLATIASKLSKIMSSQIRLQIIRIIFSRQISSLDSTQLLETLKVVTNSSSHSALTKLLSNWPLSYLSANNRAHNQCLLLASNSKVYLRLNKPQLLQSNQLLHLVKLPNKLHSLTIMMIQWNKPINYSHSTPKINFSSHINLNNPKLLKLPKSFKLFKLTSSLRKFFRIILNLIPRSHLSTRMNTTISLLSSSSSSLSFQSKSKTQDLTINSKRHSPNLGRIKLRLSNGVRRNCKNSARSSMRKISNESLRCSNNKANDKMLQLITKSCPCLFACRSQVFKFKMKSKDWSKRWTKNMARLY